jgi:hypothetical protein
MTMKKEVVNASVVGTRSMTNGNSLTQYTDLYGEVRRK